MILNIVFQIAWSLNGGDIQPSISVKSKLELQNAWGPLAVLRCSCLIQWHIPGIPALQRQERRHKNIELLDWAPWWALASEVFLIRLNSIYEFYPEILPLRNFMNKNKRFYHSAPLPPYVWRGVWQICVPLSVVVTDEVIEMLSGRGVNQ